MSDELALLRHTAALMSVCAIAACQTRGANSGDILKLPAKPPSANIAYGAAPQQTAELRLPAGTGPFPVVVVIHGGCWIQYADAGYTGHIATALTNEGWATWNIEYRRGHEPGGGWPGTFLDVGQAVDALRGAAAKHPLDLRRVVVIGHSAGGQLALWTGARTRVPKTSEVYTENPLPLRGTVALAGIADMGAYAAGGPKDCVAGELQVMGGPPEQHAARYAAVDPAQLLPVSTPQVLVWGTADNIVPQSLFADYERRSRAEILKIEGANHHDLCSAESTGWPRIVAAIRRLLD